MMAERERKSTIPEVIGSYAERDAARFHMPGHKGKRAELPFLSESWDITELPGTDDLHAPEGAILRAERDYAAAFGVRESFLCVNGSTGCVLAMLMSLGQGKRVLVARDCHRSAVSGIALAGHEVSFVYPEYENGLFGMVTPAATAAALDKTSADAVFITSPNYYGMCADIPGIAKAAHEHGALLFVDCAHGAHFAFSPALPALPLEADMFCISAHKTLSALTQGAVLHVGAGCPIEGARIRRMLSLIETSSPSYLIMASLDWSLYSARSERWSAQAARVAPLRERIAGLNGLRLLSRTDIGRAGIADVDTTRLAIDVTVRGIDGPTAGRCLIAHGVYPEMADTYGVVLITSPADDDEWYDRLYDALVALPYGTDEPKREPPVQSSGETAMTVRAAVLASCEAVPLGEAEGHICACAFGAYPPGIARRFPGERINADDILYVRSVLARGIQLFGTDGETLSCCEIGSETV